MVRSPITFASVQVDDDLVSVNPYFGHVIEPGTVDCQDAVVEVDVAGHQPAIFQSFELSTGFEFVTTHGTGPFALKRGWKKFSVPPSLTAHSLAVTHGAQSFQNISGEGSV
jgi:hypothetical protein